MTRACSRNDKPAFQTTDYDEDASTACLVRIVFALFLFAVKYFKIFFGIFVVYLSVTFRHERIFKCFFFPRKNTSGLQCNDFISRLFKSVVYIYVQILL